MNLQTPQNLWNFLSSQTPTSFSRFLINAVNQGVQDKGTAQQINC